MYYKSSEIQPNTNPKTLKFSLHWINFNLLLSPNSVITVVYIYIYRTLLTTLLKENTGRGSWYLEDWGQSLVLSINSMSGNFLITPRIKCSTPLHLGKQEDNAVCVGKMYRDEKFLSTLYWYMLYYGIIKFHEHQTWVLCNCRYQTCVHIHITWNLFTLTFEFIVKWTYTIYIKSNKVIDFTGITNTIESPNTVCMEKNRLDSVLCSWYYIPWCTL